MNILPSKYDGEHIVVSFDFSQALATGETLTSIVSVASSLNSGSGAITIGNPQISGASILAPVLGGAAGSTYILKAICDTSNADKRLEIVAMLPVL